MSGVTTRTVAGEEEGLRLDRWFKRHFPALSHIRLEKLIRTGQVRVDGGRAKANTRLEAGQAIRVPPLGENGQGPQAPASALSDKDKKLLQDLVIHKDREVIVINKPSGLASQGGSGVTRSVDGLLDALMFERPQRPRLVHRLDRDTSGVMLIARTQPAAAKLSDAFRARETRKVYWAVVRGVPDMREGTIKAALVKDASGPRGDERMRIAEGNEEEAKHAVTHYRVLDAVAREFALMELTPVTGRTHQLRVHMAALGTPILGDGKYGGAAARPQGEIQPILHLHARRIAIKHPIAGMLDVSAPLPPHMKKTLDLLGLDPNAAPLPPRVIKKKPEPAAAPQPAHEKKRHPERDRNAPPRTPTPYAKKRKPGDDRNASRMPPRAKKKRPPRR